MFGGCDGRTDGCGGRCEAREETTATNDGNGEMRSVHRRRRGSTDRLTSDLAGDEPTNTELM